MIFTVFKKYFAFMCAGIAGGFIALFIVIELGMADGFLIRRLGAEIGDIYKNNGGRIEPTIHEPAEPTVISSPSLSQTPSDFWQKTVIKSSLNIAAIQTFKDGKLLKQGSGIFVSSDGLFMTSSDTAPTGASVYQILYEDKILRGKAASRDYSKNLVLFQTGDLTKNFNVPELDIYANYQSGREMLIVGKLLNLSKPVVFSQKAMVSYILGSDIIIDTQLKNTLNGGSAIGNDGKTLGLISVRSGKVYLIGAKTIDDFLKQYLQKP